MTPRRPTLKERVEILLKKTGLNAGQLEKKAGLTPNHLRTILADPRRVELKGPTAHKLAWAAGVSLGWTSTGLGKIDAGDVPTVPHEKLAAAAVEDLATWPTVAVAAITREKGKLDWAVMGVGELPATVAPVELTEYFVLHEAEKLARRLAVDLPERERLDEKLRAFMAEHAGTRRERVPKARPSRPVGKGN